MNRYVFFTFLCFFLSRITHASRMQTELIAVRLGYSQLIIELRNRAHNFLNQEKVRMMLQEKSLRANDLNYRADELQEQQREAFENLEERINNAFKTVNQQFLAGANSLNKHDASLKEKERFIEDMKKGARRKIAQVIEKSSDIMRNNALNIDF